MIGCKNPRFKEDVPEGWKRAERGTYLYREEKEGAREFKTNLPNFDKWKDSTMNN